MNLVELDRALRKLRLSGMADVLETRLRHAQTQRLPPLHLVATLVTHQLPRGEERVFVGPPGTGKSHLGQAIGRAAIQQGYRVTYREAHVLLEEIAEATLDGTRKLLLAELATVPLLIIDDLGMR